MGISNTFIKESTLTDIANAIRTKTGSSDLLLPGQMADAILGLNVIKPKTYIIKIDQNNPDPLACCTYEGDAVGMTKGSDAWDEIFGYKPCVMQNDNIIGYLNPNNFTKYENGTSAPITDASYDVMIEFPRMGLDISTNGNIITIKLTDKLEDSNFQYRAFTKQGVVKDKFYMGAYLGSFNISNKICSVSNVAPVTNMDLTDAIANAQARGSGYDIMGFYQWTYIQCLYLLKYGNLNSQVALGKGYTSGSEKQHTGVTDTKGMCYGNPDSGTDRVKLFGLEDTWGNLYQWLGGLYCDNNYNLLTKTSNFTTGTTVSDYDFSTPSGLTSPIYDYLTQTQGTNGGGFVGKTGNGSSTTYWSDNGYVYPGYFAYMGSDWSYGANAGLFRCFVFASASGGASNRVGCRLMYL